MSPNFSDVKIPGRKILCLIVPIIYCDKFQRISSSSIVLPEAQNRHVDFANEFAALTEEVVKKRAEHFAKRI